MSQPHDLMCRDLMLNAYIENQVNYPTVNLTWWSSIINEVFYINVTWFKWLGIFLLHNNLNIVNRENLSSVIPTLFPFFVKSINLTIINTRLETKKQTKPFISIFHKFLIKVFSNKRYAYIIWLTSTVLVLLESNYLEQSVSNNSHLESNSPDQNMSSKTDSWMKL